MIWHATGSRGLPPASYYAAPHRDKALARDLLAREPSGHIAGSPSISSLSIIGDGMTAAPARRIMVVDDDASIRRTLQILLSKAGYEVIQAADGSEAVRLWRDRGGDLVITDLHMPEKDGIQTIIELLSHSPGVRIIAMSGGGQTKRLDLLGNVALLGSVLTIEKPFTLSEMMTMVSRALKPIH
jgi:CheY-like chemotaxis protein